VSKTAFLFPGQGSQIVGMGKDFFEYFEPVRAYYLKASQILGYDLTEISFNGPEEKLKQTRFTQPALYVHSHIIATILEERGIMAQAAAGHSLGEFSALAYAHAFSFEEGLELVRERANLMQQAGTKAQGSMAAIIGLEAATVLDVTRQAQVKGIVQAANFNSPEQIVISGSKEGVLAAMELAKMQGAKRVLELPVSGAFHSPLMESVSDAFGQVLDRTPMSDVRIPVYANVTASPVSSQDEIRSLLHKQLTHPVRWVETITNMVGNGITTFVEIGAGKVLSGLVKRIHREAEIFQCGTLDQFKTFGK
jgi:[acyl-carrier-protein] S-malonyltransferase